MPLELSHITHKYASRNSQVLRNLSFVFPEDRSIAVVGPSGSGKTTLLSIIGLLTRPTAGEVVIDGGPICSVSGGASRLRRQLFGWVFQTVNVLSSRTVLDNAMLGLLAGGQGDTHSRAAAMVALNTVGLGGFEARRANSLSGGELQRLCIARAIASRPRFLLADEPTGQLDRGTSDQVARALVDGRPAGTTLIVVTHDPVVARMTDMTVTLRDGALAIVETA